MKKLILIFLLLAMMLCGCAAEDVSAEPTDEQLKAAQSLQKDLKTALSLYDCKLYVNVNDGKYDVGATVEGYPTKTVFYDLVSTTIKTCKDAGAQYEGQFGTITIINGTSELGTLIWTAKDLDSGRCADTKAGTFKTINISELAEYLGVTDLVGE